MTRYCYHNRVYIASGSQRGIFCDPIKRNGKCVLSKSNQLVRFERDGCITVVVRRTLRLRSKCKKHQI